MFFPFFNLVLLFNFVNSDVFLKIALEDIIDQLSEKIENNPTKEIKFELLNKVMKYYVSQYGDVTNNIKINIKPNNYAEPDTSNDKYIGSNYHIEPYDGYKEFRRNFAVKYMKQPL